MYFLLLSVLSWITQRLFTEKINGLKIMINGLKPHSPDDRDFRYEMLGGTKGYEPKHSVYKIKTLTTKNQQTLNTCTWNGLAVQCEIDEKVPLSVASLVAYARKTGRLTGNGYSSLRENQLVAKEFGVAEESVLPNIIKDWESYSDPAQLTADVIKNAALHKTKGFFLTLSKEEVLKAIDDNRVIQTGCTWFSRYNMSGGLRAPWILPWRAGTKIGGHCFDIIGYDIPRQLLIVQNSFGPGWGDEGCFYVRFQDWFSQYLPGYVRVDFDEPIMQSVVSAYEGKSVKSATDPSIYLVKDGQKHHFPNEITFYAFRNKFAPGETYQAVAQTVLNALPTGVDVKVQDSPYWPLLANQWAVIQTLPTGTALAKIQALIQGKK